MEVVVTRHNFESILPKDHPCHVCFKLADWFQRRRLLNNFPIGSYVKTMYVRWWRPSFMEAWVTVHNFESWPFEDHSCHVCFKLTYWFQRRRLLIIFSIGSYVKTKSSHGGHRLTLDPMGISHFRLFFWNHKTDLNQTWQKCSLDGHIQDLCFWCWSEIQHGCQGL